MSPGRSPFSGIGLQIARDFGDAGGVVIAGRSEERLDAAIGQVGHDATVVAADTGDGDQVNGLVEAIICDHGRLDVVVSNAASQSCRAA